MTLLPNARPPQSPLPLTATPPLSSSSGPSQASSGPSSSTSSPSTPLSRKRKHVEDVAHYHAGNEARRRRQSAVGKIEEIGEKILSTSDKGAGESAMEMFLKAHCKRTNYSLAFIVASLEKPEDRKEKFNECLQKLNAEDDREEIRKGKEKEEE